MIIKDTYIIEIPDNLYLGDTLKFIWYQSIPSDKVVEYMNKLFPNLTIRYDKFNWSIDYNDGSEEISLTAPSDNRDIGVYAVLNKLDKEYLITDYAKCVANNIPLNKNKTKIKISRKFNEENQIWIPIMK